MELYKAYALLDYDVKTKKYLLEIYDFRDSYFAVEEFDTFSDLYNYFNDELPKFLGIHSTHILQVCSNSYQRKLRINETEPLTEDYVEFMRDYHTVDAIMYLVNKTEYYAEVENKYEKILYALLSDLNDVDLCKGCKYFKEGKNCCGDCAESLIDRVKSTFLN